MSWKIFHFNIVAIHFMVFGDMSSQNMLYLMKEYVKYITKIWEICRMF